MKELKIKIECDGKDKKLVVYETHDASTYGNGKYIGIYKDNKQFDLIAMLDCRYIKHYNFISYTIEYLMNYYSKYEIEKITIDVIEE